MRTWGAETEVRFLVAVSNDAKNVWSVGLGKNHFCFTEEVAIKHLLRKIPARLKHLVKFSIVSAIVPCPSSSVPVVLGKVDLQNCSHSDCGEDDGNGE